MTKRVMVSMSPVYIKRLKILSRKSGITVSEIIRRAVDSYESVKRGELKNNCIQV